MARGQGRVYKPTVLRHRKGCAIRAPDKCDCPRAESNVWWIDYSANGKRFQEPSGIKSKPGTTKGKRDALDVLAERMGDRKEGKLIARPDKLTLAECKAQHEIDYDLNGRRSKLRMLQCWKHIEHFFGLETKAVDVTTQRLSDYAVKRLGEGAARQTVNNELSAARRGFNLAREAGLLVVVPRFKLLDTQNARTGFFEPAEFALVLLELPEVVANLHRFVDATGWRIMEGAELQWSFVDMEGGIIRLEQARSKSGVSRLFPFGADADLKTLLDKLWTQRDGPFVFHRDGQPLTYDAVHYAWKQARKRARLEGKQSHDLRRTFCRNSRRAGLSEGEIMRLTGHKTRSVFDRYNIISEQDLAEAVARRSAKPTVNNPPSAPKPDSVS
jgi:integrase